MHILWAGVVLAIAAVWGVPIVAGILKAVVPQSGQPYLPDDTVPGFSTKTLIHALIYGVLLALVLIGLSMVGVKSERRI
jgi:ABC-type Fe3+ transport system permease subunit